MNASNSDAINKAARDEEEWEDYKQEMQRLANAAKGRQVKSAADYDPDDEPKATDTGKMHNNPPTRRGFVSKLLHPDASNTGRVYDKPARSTEVEPVATNTGKMYNKPARREAVEPVATNTGKVYNKPATRKQHLKDVENESYEVATTKHAREADKKAEAKAKARGEYKALPTREKVEQAVIAGAEIAGKVHRVAKKVDKKLSKSRLGNLSFPKPAKPVNTKQSRSKKAAKSGLPAKPQYNPNQRGELPTQRRELPTQRRELPTQTRELPTGSKDMSALQKRGGSPFAVGQAKNPLGDRSGVPPFAVGQAKNPMGNANKQQPFSTSSKSYNPAGSQKSTPFDGGLKFNNPLGNSKKKSPF